MTFHVSAAALAGVVAAALSLSGATQSAPGASSPTEALTMTSTASR
ncbi:MAG TPA: hypothetical protein VFM88_12720 [Vicinamibacteria bacterium]|nr:hypothetical protein [Vicinamibacteria bacterium]